MQAIDVGGRHLRIRIFPSLNPCVPEDCATVASEKMSNRKPSILKRARVRQIQFFTRWFSILSGIPAVSALIRVTRELPLVRGVLAALTGYNRPFATLQEATASMAGYEGGGHSNDSHPKILMKTIEQATPSDYPALFFLQPIVPLIRTVFDFGGNVGNLFYCYSKYLDLPSDFSWTVYDLPKNIETGAQIANEAGERRLRFTNSLSDADGADLFIACGALHYFEPPLPDIIAEFHRKPRYVLVNRTPLVDGRPFATVQDSGTYRVACMLYNRDDLIRRFETAGYHMVDSWWAAERSLVIPCYPDRSVAAYSGMFFQLSDDNVGKE
jgi:putative methyltransferase (TIGR04325 family)